jgi:hypothetical protein
MSRDHKQPIKRSEFNTVLYKIDWIQSFLTGRKQRAKLNNCLSDWRNVNGGIAQGTVLGPVLFLIMVNDSGGSSLSPVGGGKAS